MDVGRILRPIDSCDGVSGSFISSKSYINGREFRTPSISTKDSIKFLKCELGIMKTLLQTNFNRPDKSFKESAPPGRCFNIEFPGNVLSQTIGFHLSICKCFPIVTYDELWIASPRLKSGEGSQKA